MSTTMFILVVMLIMAILAPEMLFFIFAILYLVMDFIFSTIADLINKTKSK